MCARAHYIFDILYVYTEESEGGRCTQLRSWSRVKKLIFFINPTDLVEQNIHRGYIEKVIK